MSGLRRHLPSAAAVVGIVVVWEILAVTVFAHKTVLPTPGSVAVQLWRDRGLYQANVPTTLTEAAQGYLIGNGIAIALGTLFVLIPVAEKVLLRLAMASYALPILAVGPILQSVFSGTAPEATLAALSVLFTTLIGTMLGLRSVDPTSLDVIRALGGGRWMMLWKVRIRSALPSVFAALKIAAPAAILGALVGEYLGGNQGLGVAMIVAEQALDVPRVWGLALVTAALSGLVYIAVGLAGGPLNSWTNS